LEVEWFKKASIFEERNKSNNRNIKEEDSSEAKDTSNGRRKKESEQTEQVKLISRGNHGALQWRDKA